MHKISSRDTKPPVQALAKHPPWDRTGKALAIIRTLINLEFCLFQVNRTNQWKDILNEFHIPKGCVNGGNALKQIYLRYLDRYEKVHYLGESSDRHDLDEEDIETRHRRWSTRSIHTVPLTYNHHQHNVLAENLRKLNGLSSDIYKPSDYDRLALSLVSPLPNEQDFAINVCTLLSNEGKHTLKLEKCPRIIDYLLAHAGVYNHSNLRILFEEVYGQIRGHSLSTFWSDVLECSELLDLTDENKFVKRIPKRYKVHQTQSGRTNQNGFINEEDAETERININPRKNEVRTVERDLTGGSESKVAENDRVNNEMPESSNIPNNIIEDSVQPEKYKDRVQTVDDSVTRAVNDSAFEDDPKVLTIENSSENSSKDVYVDDSVDKSAVQNVKVDSSPSAVYDEPTTAVNVTIGVTLVQETAKSESDLNESVSSTAVTNSSGSETAKCQPSEVKCDNQEKTFSVEEEPRIEPDVANSENNDVAPVLTPEEIALAEEERIKEEERLRVEKERLEEEERIRKQAEEARRIEEERIRAIEEAKKLEKQMKEAEFYEAMLRKEEKKKRPYDWDETPVKRSNPGKSTLKIEAEDLELFCLGRQNGTNDYIGQRILQVAHILRNLTFCDESMHVMAKNTTFLRFLLLCINSKWSSLHQLGLDMLGNISSELTIEDPAVDRVFQAFFWTVHRGIHHTNRFFVISCLEILNKICQKDENEDVVCRNLDQNIYDQVCRLLSLHDIMILLYTLECLYSMSSMGEKACTYICRSKGAIEMLLALITVEAQSYGPKACILMRVIETVSGTAASSMPTVQPPSAPSPGVQTQLTTAMAQQPCPPQTIVSIATPTTMTVQSATIPKIITPTIMRTPSPKAVMGMPMAAVATPVQLTPNLCTPIMQTMPTVQQQHAHQQTVQENEQFALAWIRANFELCVGGKVEQQDLYRRYVESCNKMGRKGVIASMHFPRFVRSVFGGSVGPKARPLPQSEVKPGGPTTQSCYDGIKVRDVPLTINIKLVPVTEVPRPVMKKRLQVSTPKPKGKRKKPESPTSPILKAQLISPNKPSSPSPSPTPNLADGKVQVSTQTHTGQVVLGPGSSPPCTPPPMDNSTLIKSLLASKVSEICMTAPVGMLPDNPQVTQRQQQQKILLQQQQIQIKQADSTPIVSKVVRLNGIIQDTSVPSPSPAADGNHLTLGLAKGKKEPPQPPTSTATTVGNLHRPKTPKLDGEDSDSMASTSCAATGGGNVSSADDNDNDNSLTSFEGIFNGIPESLDLDATVSTIVNENCSKKSALPGEEVSGENNADGVEQAAVAKSQDIDVEDKQHEKSPESCVKQAANKSLMLADLLDKKEGPALNGVLGKDLRIGEKGFELVEKAILKETHLNHKGVTVKKESVVNVNGESRTGGGDRTTTVINNATPSPQCGNKRPASSSEPDQDERIEEKRVKMEAEAEDAKDEVEEVKQSEEVKGPKEEVNGDEEVRASSTAANLFAALAAEALEDETDLEVPSDPQPQPVMVPQGQQIRPLYLGESSPLIVTASGTRQIIMTPSQLSQQGQVLISAGGQSLPVLVQNQRIVQGGSGQMLVTSQPQQYIMSGNTQSQMLIAQPQTALVQGQPQTVLVAQATPQQPGTKTIIILQPQSQGNANSSQQKMVMTSQGTPMVVTSVARQVVQSQPTPPLAAPVPPSLVPTSNTRDGATTDIVLNSGIQNNSPAVSNIQQNGSQIQIINSGVLNNAPAVNQNGNDKNKTQNGTSKVVATTKPVVGSIYLCEWRGCMRSFKTANEVYMHVCNTHCPSSAEVETQCLWERCDGMKRKRFSLMTHLFDRHCNADTLNMMAARRKQLSTQGRSEIPAPTPPPPHPGYAPNAAFHAIKRHALEFVNPKELLDDNEGPVTKSIRLTASLILRNLVIYSSVGRRFLKGYEPHLASIALSNVESSRTIAQVLADLNDSSNR
ncbi:hypothetical protein RUM43_006444 [Polyplax serrata]|uniref:AT-rich interactive domain-containing protein 2 n=1 Tax=Polyplax serrata TaxID=468196 RepID=A0AAN8S924_POLSC